MYTYIQTLLAHAHAHTYKCIHIRQENEREREGARKKPRERVEGNKQKEKGKLVERTCESEYAVSQRNVQNIDEIDGKHDWWYCRIFCWCVERNLKLHLIWNRKMIYTYVRAGKQLIKPSRTYTIHIHICAQTHTLADRQTKEMLEDRTNGFYFGVISVRMCI